jgi:hypothetical protein
VDNALDRTGDQGGGLYRNPTLDQFLADRASSGRRSLGSNGPGGSEDGRTGSADSAALGGFLGRTTGADGLDGGLAAEPGGKICRTPNDPRDEFGCGPSGFFGPAYARRLKDRQERRR